MDTGEGKGGGKSHPCAQCSQPIAEPDHCLECYGKCRLSIHAACLPNATPERIEVLGEIPNAMFVCDTCLALHEYDDGHTEKVLSDIVAKIDELSCVINFVKNFESAVRKIVREELVRDRKTLTVTDNKEGTRSRIVTRSESKKRKAEEADADDGEAKKRKGEEAEVAETEVAETDVAVAVTEFVTPKASFAKVVQQRIVITEEEQKQKQSKKPDPVVVIKPKAGVAVENARMEVQKKVSSKNMNVQRVYTNKNGEVVVALKDKASVQVLQENVMKQLGERYDVQLRDSLKPTIKIIGMPEEMEEDELRETLVDHNDSFGNLKHFKLFKSYRNEKWSYNNNNAIVELDADTYFKVLDAGKVNCGWKRCRVFDGLQVLRCFKCNGFNHKGADCKAAVVTCAICSGPHEPKNCKAESAKCSNCEKLKNEKNVDIDVNHAAWSSECPVYRKQQARRNKLVDYTQ